MEVLYQLSYEGGWVESLAGPCALASTLSFASTDGRTS